MSGCSTTGTRVLLFQGATPQDRNISLFFQDTNGFLSLLWGANNFVLIVNEVSVFLNNCDLGFSTSDQFINHSMYAENSVLPGPFPISSQQILNFCDIYYINNDIIFNITNRVVMCVKPRKLKYLNVPNIFFTRKECLSG